MALFTSILAFAGSATNALATAAAPNARRDFSTSGSGALDGLRAAAEATTNKKRIGAAVRTQARGCLRTDVVLVMRQGAETFQSSSRVVRREEMLRAANRTAICRIGFKSGASGM